MSGAAAPGRPGRPALLASKALQLTGGPNSPPPPAGRNVYGMLVATGQADVFLTYCTNAVAARAQAPQLQLVDIAPEINVSAQYGVAVLEPGGADAQAYAQFLIGPKGRRASRCTASWRPDGSPCGLSAASSGGRSATRARRG